MGYICLMLTSKAVVSILGAMDKEERPTLGPFPEVPEGNGKVPVDFGHNFSLAYIQDG